MKIVDIVILAVYVIALIALCFFFKCSLDIYFMILAFAVALMSGIAMIIQRKNGKTKELSE